MSDKFTIENGHEGILPTGKYRVIDGELFRVSDCPMAEDPYLTLTAKLMQLQQENSRLRRGLEGLHSSLKACGCPWCLSLAAIAAKAMEGGKDEEG